MLSFYHMFPILFHKIILNNGKKQQRQSHHLHHSRLKAKGKKRDRAIQAAKISGLQPPLLISIERKDQMPVDLT